MTTDNNQDKERIDRLEAIIQRHDVQMEMIQAIQSDQATTQQDQTATIQRHDMFLEMLRAAQEMFQATQQDLAESHRLREETQREQAVSIQRHDMLLEMALATQERQEENQNLMINLLQTFSTMLHRVMDTQQEHGHAIRGLEESRDNTP